MTHSLLISIPGTTDHPISPEEVVDYPSPAEGLPPLTDSPAALAAAASALAAGTGPIAVDAERASGFRYGQEAYLIQMRREGSGTFLIDPTACGEMSALAEATRGPEWILHAADQDLPCLAELGLAPTSLFDTELAAKILGRERVGLGAVLEETLGVRLAKDHAAADWSTRPLPATWLNYAALDVELLIELRAALAAELEQAGRTEWAQAEFEYVRTRPPRAPKLDPWRHVAHSGRAQRTQRSLAVLREMWTVREELAQEEDVTPSKVLPHAALVAAAVVQPRSRRQLMALKEFSSRQARQHREEWWRALERAMALPESQLPPRRAPLAPGELPAPKTWGRNHEEAATALRVVKKAVLARATELRMPQEILLAPAAQKQLAWEVGSIMADGGTPDFSEAHLAQRLTFWEARPWQIEQVTGPIAAALTRKFPD